VASVPAAKAVVPPNPTSVVKHIKNASIADAPRLKMFFFILLFTSLK
jgi:hypothetical protein